MTRFIGSPRSHPEIGGQRAGAMPAIASTAVNRKPESQSAGIGTARAWAVSSGCRMRWWYCRGPSAGIGWGPRCCRTGADSRDVLSGKPRSPTAQSDRPRHHDRIAGVILAAIAPAQYQFEFEPRESGSRRRTLTERCWRSRHPRRYCGKQAGVFTDGKAV